MACVWPSHYDVLGIPSSSSDEQIRTAYRALILREHPDKATTRASEKGNERFHQIREAWRVLRDPVLRERYDAHLRELQRKSEVVITAEMDIADFSLVSEGVGEGEEKYGVPCRCGGVYRTSHEELLAGISVIACDGCSLYIRVLFDIEEEEGEEEKR